MPAVDLKAVLPEFNCTADYVVDQYLTRAVASTTALPESVREWGGFLLAAHNMARNGVGVASSEGLTSWKSGTVTMTFSDATADAKGFNSTKYGKQYMDLLRENGAGVFVAFANG